MIKSIVDLFVCHVTQISLGKLIFIIEKKEKAFECLNNNSLIVKYVVENLKRNVNFNILICNLKGNSLLNLELKVNYLNLFEDLQFKIRL